MSEAELVESCLDELTRLHLLTLNPTCGWCGLRYASHLNDTWKTCQEQLSR